MLRRRAAAENPPHSTTRPKTVRLVSRSMAQTDYPLPLDDASRTPGIITAAPTAHSRRVSGAIEAPRQPPKEHRHEELQKCARDCAHRHQSTRLRRLGVRE